MQCWERGRAARFKVEVAISDWDFGRGTVTNADPLYISIRLWIARGEARKVHVTAEPNSDLKA